MMRLAINLILLSVQLTIAQTPAPQQKELREIISDDFLNARPKPKRASSSGNSKKRSRVYHSTSNPIAESVENSGMQALQLGVTVWKIELPINSVPGNSGLGPAVLKRVEADRKFKDGDLIRVSIESPRTGYLYVIDRDLFSDGRSGETNLIFPIRGEDNRLQAGKLIQIPAENRAPFRASPTANQAGELLTIIVVSAPISVPLANRPIPVSSIQLNELESKWGGMTQRFEMDNGAGQTRTLQELEATTTRQLTREDPGPQTIFLVNPKNRDGLLVNILLSYIR